MSKETPKNMGQSVIDRLRKKALAEGQALNFLRSRYQMERLLYRLSLSSHSEKFALKGGTLFLAWQGRSYRVTRDVDFLGHGSSDISDIEAIFRDVCSIEVEDDGIQFLAASVTGSKIQVDTHYAGVRIQIEALLNGGKDPLIVEIGFGDAVTPNIENIEFPSLLNMPIPKLRAYPKATVIAEKFEAMIDLGIANSRIKDFYDIWLMGRLFEFDGLVLKQAIENTFERRKTPFPAETPFAFTEEFYGDVQKQTQWRAFARKNQIETFGEILDLETIIQEIVIFLMPVIEAIQKQGAFNLFWSNENRSWINPSQKHSEVKLN